MIQKQQRHVFYAPTRNRAFLTLKSAIKAEAIAIIFKKYPREPFEADTGHYFDISTEPRFKKMVKRMSYIIKKSYEAES